ncbi:MAG: hypothetical protein IPN01_09485 [Deltaproteobacteria bacterium]|nr:hypothetical protein [Deltaproteobacteria bacterium]
MFLFTELHVDDAFLERRRDRATYHAARALVEEILTVAESQGHRLGLRLRFPFAEAALAFEGPDNAVARWAARGHELGAHAHKRNLARAATAIRAAGVTDLRVAVPGLIQADRAECARVLRSCLGLGFTTLTDQPQLGAFAYSGLTPWRPALDLSGPGDGPFLFIDASVNPYAWGLLRREGDHIEQTIGLGAEHFERLLGLLDAQLRLPRPHPVTTFGVPLHEHQLGTAWEDLRPNEVSLQAFGDYLAAAAKRPVRPVTALEVHAAWEAVEGALPAAGPVGEGLWRLDPRGLRHDVPNKLRERLRPDLRPLIPALAPARALRARVAELRRQRPAAQAEREDGGVPLALRVGSRDIDAVRYGPEEAEVAIVLSHAGVFGGRMMRLGPFGLRPRDLPGVTIWAWDRRGTGRSRGETFLAPGNPQHVEEAEALFGHAARAAGRVGWLTFSGGLVAPLLALKTTDPAFFVDGEGPSDRRSMSPGRPQGLLSDPLGAELRHLNPEDDAAWAYREPYRLVGALRCPYHRLQAAWDHAHGPMALHARVMMEHAPAGAQLNGAPWDGTLRLWPGRLHEHGERVRKILLSLAQGESRVIDVERQDERGHR